MKGIIVLDVPKNCKECCLMTSSGHCSPTHRDIFRYGVKEKKPNWCPIREAPVTLEEIKSPHSMGDFQRKGFSRGWKSCIDTIIGEKGGIE